MMENLPRGLRVLLSATFKAFNEEAFLTKPVGELMWGYDSKLVDFLNKYLPGMLPTSGKFGLFAEVSVDLFCKFLITMCENSRFLTGEFTACELVVTISFTKSKSRKYVKYLPSILVFLVAPHFCL